MLLDNIAEKKLDNGLKVIALRKTGAPIVSVQLWYKIGSIGEHDGIRGISHFLEHMMFRGSRRFKSEEHAQRINEVGGHSNAFTTEDVTVFTNSVPSEFCELVFELEADRMQHLTLDVHLFETERKVILEEYHLNMNNPVSKAFLEFRQEFFRNHPYSISPLGVISDLEMMTVEQCRKYYETWYHPNNAVLTVVGDIDSKRIFQLAESHFCDINKTSPSVSDNVLEMKRSTDTPRLNRMKRIVDFDVPLLIIGYPGPPSSHEDAVALEILQLVIAGGESSRLHREAVRRQSAAVMVGGMNHLLKYAGMSMFLAAFTPDVRVTRVEKVLESVIDQIRTDGISEHEMDKVKNTTLTNRTFELYNAENICHRLGYSECIEGDYRTWVKRLESLKSLDINRLVHVAREYWDDTHRHVLHLHPRKTSPLLYMAGLLRHITSKRRKD